MVRARPWSSTDWGFAPVNQGQRGVMDLSGGMPTKAWIEIRNVRGDLQERIAAHIEGGTVSAECPAFPPGRRPGGP